MVITGLYFLIFFISFFAASVIRFQYYLIHETHSGWIILLLAAIAAGAGGVLFLGFNRLSLFRGPRRSLLLKGGVFGLLWFWAIFWIEDGISQSRLERGFAIEQFGEYQKHCGVRVGRVISGWYSSPLETWKMNDRCRIRRWIDHANHSCNPGDFVCATDAMRAFGSKGNWSVLDRKFFYHFIFPSGVEVSNDSLIHFFVMDQELLHQRKPWAQQVGLEVQFTDLFSYYQQRDELDNVLFTQEVFEAVKVRIPIKGEPRFNEYLKKAQFEIEKIPQLQGDLNVLEKKLNYNPSL